MRKWTRDVAILSLKYMAAGLVLGMALFVLFGLASAQTGALPTFCGFPSVAFPTGGVLNAASLHASQSVANTTASASPTVPTVYGASITGALVFVEQSAIRARTDGPTVSGTFDGNPYPAGSTIQVCGSDLARWSAIASSSGANAVLRWNFYTSGR